jgi:hypothetical protein
MTNIHAHCTAEYLARFFDEAKQSDLPARDLDVDVTLSDGKEVKNVIDCAVGDGLCVLHTPIETVVTACENVIRISHISII